MNTNSSEKMFELLQAEVVKNPGLLVHYQSDLEVDKIILEAYPNSEFVWVLRECGTAMIPLYKGVDSTHITYWVKEEKSKFFHLTRTEIKEISRENASFLAEKPPFNPALCDDAETLLEMVNAVLSDGHERGWWESNGKSWAEMENKFSNSSNKVMAKFLFDAIECRYEFNQRQSAYGA